MTVPPDTLQDLMVTALINKTAALDHVYLPRDWPTTPQDMPIILVQSPDEHKESLGRSGAPQFTVTTTIRLVGRIFSPAETGDAGAYAALSAIGLLQRQIEVAVINDYALRSQIQQFKSIDAKNTVNSDSEYHVAELVMDFSLEFYQGPEDFAPNLTSPIEEMAIYIDLVNVFSPTGTFSGTPFADDANPSPRTSGPDGRAEGKILTTLPQ